MPDHESRPSAELRFGELRLLEVLQQERVRADELQAIIERQRAEIAELTMQLGAQNRENERRRDELRQATREGVVLRESHHRRTAQLSTLSNIGAVLVSELDRSRLSNLIVETAREVTGATYAALFVRQPGPADGSPIFVPAALAGAERSAFPDIAEVDPERMRFAGILRALLSEGRGQFVADVAAEAERHGFPPDHPSIGSYVAEALFDRTGAVLGALLVGDPRASFFVPDDAEFISLLASQAAVALENAAYYEAEESARRAVEAERELLAEMTARLRSVMHSISDGLIVFDRANRAVVVNPVIRELFGIETNPLGWTPTEFAREIGHCFADPTVPSTIVEQTISGQAEERMEFELVQPRQRWIERLIAPIRGPGGGVLGQVVVYHDLTERRQAERLKDEFLSIASHELRTPLTTVKAHVQMLLRRLDRGEAVPGPFAQRAADQLRSVDRQTTRLARLIDELLDVSRIQSGRLELHARALDLAELVRETLDSLRLAVESHPIRLVSDEQPLPVRADADRVEQVLVNLVTNAVRYSEAGRPVTIGLERASDRAGRACGRLFVRDLGIGIEPNDLERIFTRFFRTSNDARPRAGLGLGLYIASEIVRRHGGELWVESHRGEGSTFYVDLPLRSASSAESSAAS